MLNNTSPGIIPKQEGGIKYHKRCSPKSVQCRSNVETMKLQKGKKNVWERVAENGSEGTKDI
jgi:hypothetical protein